MHVVDHDPQRSGGSSALAGTPDERTQLFLNAPAAIAILRGPDHVIELANAAWLELAGKRPSVIGRPLLEAMPELRGQGWGALLREVMRSGARREGSEVPATVHRGGKPQTAYLNFVYTPTKNGRGEVDGVAVFGFDVTAQVMARQRATLGASVGRALVSDAPLPDQLRRCCEALVALGAAFARIWTYNASDAVLELRASAGMYTHLDGAHARVPLGALKIGRIAKDRAPHLTNAVIGDPEVANQEWAQREAMVAFAGYPLVVGDRLVGVLALFAKHPLPEETLAALSSVADQIALGIERDDSERFRELFIGMLGHDLRNPLNAIAMAAHLLAGSPLQDGQRRNVERVRKGAARMTRMIAQVLDFTRARSGGGIPLTRAPADLPQICAQAIEELASASPQRTVEIQSSGEATGEWDSDRLLQVVSNLVGNALGYSPADTPVLVRVECIGDEVRCSVHNRGAPIPATLLPTLFDPFRRAVDGKTDRTQGLGLGLFISKQIVMAHGGRLTVRSTDREGTEFALVLPRT